MAFYRARRRFSRRPVYRRRKVPRRLPKRRTYRKKVTAPVVVPVQIPVSAVPDRWSRFKAALPYYAKKAALAAAGGAIGGLAYRKYGSKMREMSRLRNMRDTYAQGTYRLRRMANNWRYLRRISPSRVIDVANLESQPSALKSPRYN